MEERKGQTSPSAWQFLIPIVDVPSPFKLMVITIAHFGWFES